MIMRKFLKLISLDFNFIFIVPHLSKTQEDEYKDYLLYIVYQFLLLSLHKITTSGCGIRPTTH